jgi:heat shock protein HtpX
MYSQIDANKRRTNFLLAIFVIIVTALVILTGTLSGLAPQDAFVFGFIFSSLYGLFAFYASSKMTLFSQGAKEIEFKDNPELFRIVENLSITAGIPMPKIYIINDAAPNAFATGRDPNNAAVAFTTGLLTRLNRSEIEAVAAHEIGHIKNYDIRIMTIVVVLLGLVVLISDLLIRLPLYMNRGEKQDFRITAAAFIAGILLGLLSPLFAKLIQFAISRSREYLADATGALLTRYPEALASALEKISMSNEQVKHATNATAHLYISNPFAGKKGFINNLFSTHPPIQDRIAKLREMM